MVRRSFWTISLIVLLALAGMGVGYGLWFENLFIAGTVTTGTVDVEITATVEEVESKDVGTCVIDEDMLGENLVLVDVDNAYPSYECWVTVAVANVGTVPVHLTLPEWWDEWEGWTDEVEPFELIDFDEDCFETAQVHPGESESCRFLIHFDNEDGLEMGATYAFAYQFRAHQYNEPPGGGGCVGADCGGSFDQ